MSEKYSWAWVPATIASNVEKGRSWLAGKIQKTNLPYSYQLGMRVMTKRHRVMAEEFGDTFRQSQVEFSQLVTTLTTQSPICAKWLTMEHYLLMLPDEAREKLGPPGAELVASDALLFMHHSSGKSTATVIKLFERYAISEATFAALMLAYVRLPYYLTQKGYFDPTTGEPHRPQEDQEIIRLLSTDYLAKELIYAYPGHWEYDVLLSELRTL